MRLHSLNLGRHPGTGDDPSRTGPKHALPFSTVTTLLTSRKSAPLLASSTALAAASSVKPTTWDSEFIQLQENRHTLAEDSGKSQHERRSSPLAAVWDRTTRASSSMNESVALRPTR